ncbi:PstS family phosphate ABC transporter substrate-binding protein [Alkalinema sp. FACHB-956]|uniref:PstS family phosphate ABC transporter substrate-binding protein n=1 Tax=Alkalinema sp. FACHB-956 TaxID=2692768 RepID=UPI0032208747
MMLSQVYRSITIGAVVTIASIVGFSATAQAQVKVDGSSTVFPITEAAAAAFQKSSGQKVTVGISGTGGGLKKFCNGETDISNASRPILEKELKLCKEKGIKFIEIPVAMDALTVVVSPQNNWVNNLTVDQLKKVWDAGSTVKNWKEIDGSFPDAPLKLFGPGADSGTFDYFTEAINGKAKKSRTDYTGSEDDNVLVQGVSRDKNALGYFGFAYYQKNNRRLKAVKVNGVEPSLANVTNGSYRPLSRPLFIYVNADSAKNKQPVKSFVESYLNGASGFASKVGYLPLIDQVYSVSKKHLSEGKTGTRFAGKEPTNLKMEDLVKMEPKD